MKPQLGRLEKINLRQVWTSEASDFTPWLAEENNLKLLGDTVGIDLELEAVEKNVGPYRADILCRDTATNSMVLIENQLETTDHTHLGQILTYAAGLNAVSVIWIAKRFTDEHQATMEWLNEITGDDINFFGLEVELWKIGESIVAPKFNVACKPNDWTKSGGATGAGKRILTETKLKQLEFWRGFREYALEHAKRFKPTKALPQHWMNISIGKTGFVIEAIAAFQFLENQHGTKGVRADFVLHGDDAKGVFTWMLERKEEIESAVGCQLSWHDPDGKRRCRIMVSQPGDISDLETHHEFYEWLTQKLDKFHEVFGGLIKEYY